MGEILVKTCDILGRKATKAKPIHKVRLHVEVHDGEMWKIEHETATKDMCPDAIKRAIKFAERAVSRPNIAATNAADAEAKADVPEA